ncbi:MAG: acyl-CoA synthetase [Acidimicrobiales bacterium]|nr:acyl-CoA synthetase [Acidimicrobiales bacterium]
MAAWNYATTWEIAADNLPDSPALLQGDRVITWKEFDRRADGLARTLLDAGAEHQDKVAQYLYNCPEYLESMFACFKAGLVPVNTNYRYADDELLYLWDNADAVAVVFHGTFAERIERIRDRVPKVKTWLWVDDGSGPCPDWAVPYEQAAATPTDRVVAPWGRSDDDILMMYTGGTTGMPKGVMWRQDSLMRATTGATNAIYREDPDYDELRKTMTMPGLRVLPGCPLMHGTGQFTSLIALSTAGSVVTLVNRHFDVEELLDTVQEKKVNMVVIVGDAFAKPMLRALEENPGRWDLSSVIAMTSSGVMWSKETKDGLLKHNPTMMLIDAFSSSEAIGLGQSVSTAGGSSGTAKFVLGENARVITDDGRDVEPGSGEIGRVAVKGFTPIGYYKDPEKSARTFVVIDGDTYSIPGDYATVEADGTLTLLGRGSVCINTGGEKVFPEEVEEVLKKHPAVLDSVVVGVPDDKFGEAITAVVEFREGESATEEELINHVKAHLAGFKAPKRVVSIDTIGRAPNGKVDYKRMKAYAAEQLGIPVAG